MANGKRGKSRKPKKDTIRFCRTYHPKRGNAKRKCKTFGRRKMTAKQKKFFG